MTTKKIYLKIIGILAVFNCVACLQTAEKKHTNTIAFLEKKLDSIFDNSSLTGLSVVVTNHEKIVFQRSFGYADVGTKKPYTNYTAHNIASISKTFIGVALMKAIDEQKLLLDEDINTYLPFKVTHPLYPDTPITLRHLANHTSGILDDGVYGASYVLDNPDMDTSTLPEGLMGYIEDISDNQPIDESQFLENALSTAGDWYNEDSFSDTAPGTVYEYSNLAATLAAFVIEKAVGTSYEKYTNEKIFKPLNMPHTVWNKSDQKAEHRARLYVSKELAVPPYTLVTKADGGIITNTTDFSNYLIEMLNGYKGEGTLLSKSAYATLFRTNSTDGKGMGIFWEIDKIGRPRHDGGDPGVITNTALLPKKNMAYFTMCNISPDLGADIMPDLYYIWKLLEDQSWN